MSFIPSFSVAQLQSNLNVMRITDTGTGDFGTITQRRVIITNSAETILLPPYVQWAIGDLTIDISVLTRDLALFITVQWLNVSNVVVNEVTNSFDFDQRNLQFYYYLAQLQTGLPPIVQNTNYFRNAGVFYTNLQGAKYAILFEGSLVNSQPGLDRATSMQLQQNKYF